MSWRKKMRRARMGNPGVTVSCPPGYTLKCVSFGGPTQSCKCEKCGGAPYGCQYADPIVKPADQAAGFGYAARSVTPPPPNVAALRNPSILMPALAQPGTGQRSVAPGTATGYVNMRNGPQAAPGTATGYVNMRNGPQAAPGTATGYVNMRSGPQAAPGTATGYVNMRSGPLPAPTCSCIGNQNNLAQARMVMAALGA